MARACPSPYDEGVAALHTVARGPVSRALSRYPTLAKVTRDKMNTIVQNLNNEQNSLYRMDTVLPVSADRIAAS